MCVTDVAAGPGVGRRRGGDVDPIRVSGSGLRPRHIDYSRRVPPQSSSTPSAWAPTLRRSVSLFRAFRKEQTEPAVFYGALAADSAAQLAQYVDLGRGDDARRRRRAGLLPDRVRGARRGATSPWTPTSASSPVSGEIAPRTVIGSGMQLPFCDGTFDVCYSSNVLEHVPDPWLMADEMVRVTKPGGIIFISYTVWYGPGAATRPRRGTSSAVAAPASATDAGTDGSRRTSTASPCSP